MDKTLQIDHILSIQSTVTYGYVGNKVSTYALQRLGFHCDPINTVMLSNHTGYKIAKGMKLNGSNFKDIIAGLRSNNFLSKYNDLISGYMGTEEVINEFALVIKNLYDSNSSLKYLCDPVLGDDFKLYVPEVFVNIFRDNIISYATIITPNQTEASFLSGIKINNIDDAKKCCKWFHNEKYTYSNYYLP